MACVTITNYSYIPERIYTVSLLVSIIQNLVEVQRTGKKKICRESSKKAEGISNY